MEEWKEYKLGEVLAIKYGKDHKRLADGNIPIYGSGGIMRYGEQSIYEGPSILIPRKGSLNNILYSDKPFWTVDTMFWTIINEKVANPLFVYYSICKKNFASLNIGSAVPSLTVPVIEDIDILLPSKATQDKIVSILKSLDDKIENNRKINENLEQQAQALFKSWFVDFEPFRDQPFVESELGMIPEGWRVEELGKLIETTSGGTPSRKIDNYYNNGSIYWVKSKELLDNFIINTEEKITDVAIKESSAKLLPSHSVLIAMYGATVGALGITTKPMACNQAICALLPNQLLPYTFLYLFAKFSKIYLQNKAVGSAQQNISQIIIKSLKVSYNSNAIKRFNSIVEPLLTIIEKNAFESHRLSLLRDTLLPKLMSGEIKL